MAIKAKITEKEFEKIVLDLAKQGVTSEKIGIALKKEHGIKKAKSEFGKRISDVLKANNVYVDADIKNITEKVERLKKHKLKHKGDKSFKRALMSREAKLRKLTK